MSRLGELWARARRLGRRLGLGHGHGAPPVFHSPSYRLPLAGAEATLGVEPRRAELVLSVLLAEGVIGAEDVRVPPSIGWGDLARVHDAALLEGLTDPAALARTFAADPREIEVDELIELIRSATGGTLAAARAALERRGPAFNLLGGFHHAGPSTPGPLCPVNDLAVAVAALRAEGRARAVTILDFDAHPPDGTAACFQGDAHTFIGSISGVDWGPLPGVDETVLPAQSGDAVYLRALDALLARAPRGDLTLVLAGGDVLAGDKLGGLGLTLAGARARDLRVARHLRGTPSVWLPGGGYHRDSWRLLAGTVMAVTLDSDRPVPPGDPMRQQYQALARGLMPDELGKSQELDERELLHDLGMGRSAVPRLVDYYTAQGLELALERYGVLPHLRRLGYRQLTVQVDASAEGDRARVFGRSEGARELLIELVVERRRIAVPAVGETPGAEGAAAEGAAAEGVARGAGGRTEDVLFVHWLTLRHPRAAFGPRRPQLPGQELPGLGLARESGELLRRMAARVGLAGVVFCPAHFHTAYAARHDMHFVEAARQGRFEALLRDTRGRSLLEVTTALDAGRVRLNGAPYRWEATEMVHWLEPREDAEAWKLGVGAARERARFDVVE